MEEITEEEGGRGGEGEGGGGEEGEKEGGGGEEASLSPPQSAPSSVSYLQTSFPVELQTPNSPLCLFKRQQVS